MITMIDAPVKPDWVVLRIFISLNPPDTFGSPDGTLLCVSTFQAELLETFMACNYSA